MKTAVVTYIYSAGLSFLPDFLQSLATQSDQDFDLFIFNDGVERLDSYLKDCKKKYTILPVRGTVVEIRFHSISKLDDTNFDAFIFQDIDDRMSANRVQKCRELLQHYPLVCNDLSLVDDKGNSITTSTWSARLQDGFEFDHSFIADKNIAGLGNTAIRRSLLNNSIQFHSSPRAADWFIFYQLLYQSGIRAVFTSGCQTIYRQHVNNTAGLKEADTVRLKQVVQVSRQHYTGLTETGYTLMNEHRLAMIAIEKLLAQNNYQYLPPVSHENLYWWEEQNYLYEKN